MKLFSLLIAAALGLLAATPPVRGQAPGSVQAFNANIVGTEVLAMAVQPDGKTIIAGTFSSVLGVPRQNIARLNANGTLDTIFDPRSDDRINSVIVQADGKVLLAGAFTTLQPNGAASTTPRQRVARVNRDGTLDATFDPKADAQVATMVLQTDGKVLIGGSFTSLQPNGAASATARQSVARVHADGTLDLSFDLRANGLVLGMAVQADGKVLLAGTFTRLQPNGTLTPTTRLRVARVLADGTVDLSFNPAPNSFLYCVAVQADGKVLLGGNFTALQPNGGPTSFARQRVARFHADGTLDLTFDPGANGDVLSFAVQADGKVLLGGAFTSLQPNGAASPAARRFVARVLADGTLDTAFDPAADGTVSGVALQADGTVLLGGQFTTLQPNGAPSASARKRFARLHNDPSVQTLSSPDAATVRWERSGGGPSLMEPVTVERSTDGGATWTALGLAARVGASETWQLSGLSLPARGLLRARGRATGGYFGGTSGIVEQVEAFGPIVPFNAEIVGTEVLATAVQADGKTIIAGTFTSVLGVPRQNIARLNADGSLDALFDPKTNGVVNTVAVQTDGMVLLGGNFTSLQANGAGSATQRHRVARVRADGALDTGYDPRINGMVFCIALQADGRALIAGRFDTLEPNGNPAGIGRQSIARVNVDGTVDPNFDPKANDAIQTVAVQADGKVLLGGAFTTLRPNGAASATPRRRVARVNADGTLDAVFDPGADASVTSVVPLRDGKLLLAGQFTSLQPNGAASPTPRQNVARVFADGTLDTTFNPAPNGSVSSATVQADGMVLLGGAFTAFQPNGGPLVTLRGNVARIQADGTVDAAFNPGANGPVLSVALQGDGSVLLGGSFNTLRLTGAPSTTERNLFARLLNEPATQAVQAPNAGQVLWVRGGTAPELASVSFERSANGGGTWIAVGSATRVGTTADWQRTGLSLPDSGLLRARGRTLGGSFNGSAGFVEQVAAFDINESPSITVNGGGGAAGPTGLEGTPTQQTGTFSDPEGNATATLTASLGAVTQNNAAGTWSWTGVGPDGPATPVVTITATDVAGLASSASFTFTVLNASPVLVITAVPAAREDSAVRFTFTAVDPSAGDQAAGFDWTLIFNDGSPIEAVAAGTVSPLVRTHVFADSGVISVLATAADRDSSFSNFAIYVISILDTETVKTTLFAKGGPVPGAGITGSGIAAGAIWSTFGVPSINDAGEVAFIGTWKEALVLRTGVFRGPAALLELLVRKGDAVLDGPLGAVYATFGAPALAADGACAFVATFANSPGAAGVTAANNTALCAAYPRDQLRVVARRGDEVPGVTGAQWKSFPSVSLCEGALAWTGTMVTGPGSTAGPGGVTRTDDMGLWVRDQTTGFINLAIREGQPMPRAITGVTVRTISALVARPGSAGQGHGIVDTGPGSTSLVLRLTGSDGRHRIARVDRLGGLEVEQLAGDPATPFHATTPPLWSGFGLPTQDGVGALAFLGTVKAEAGVATALDNSALIHATGSLSILARKGSVAIPGGVFSTFRDPVAGSEGTAAFAATLKANSAAGITAANSSTLWWRDAAGTTNLLARKSNRPPEVAAGAVWATFPQLALPDSGTGPLFIATMLNRTPNPGGPALPGPGGVIPANDTGLWGIDSLGDLRLLVREGDLIAGKTVRTFTALSAVPGSPAQRRSFNNQGAVIYRVTFTDGSQAIVQVQVP